MTNNTTLTAETITTAQIRALRDSAGEAGDMVQVHACEVALDEQDLVTTADAYEDCYGGSGRSKSDREAILAIADKAQAIEMCVDAINAAQG